MKTKLTPEDIEELCGSHQFMRLENSTLTVCVLELTNGCTVTGTSNVINPGNFDAEMGERVALTNAKGKVWELEGYALRRAAHAAALEN